MRAEEAGAPEPFTTPGPDVDAGHCIHAAVKLNDSVLLLVGSTTPWSIIETSILYVKSENLRRGPRPWFGICSSNIIIPFRDEDQFLMLGGNLPIANAA